MYTLSITLNLFQHVHVHKVLDTLTVELGNHTFCDSTDSQIATDIFWNAATLNSIVIEMEFNSRNAHHRSSKQGLKSYYANH